MSRSSSLILLGVLTILVPFSGLPSTLRTLLLVIVGGSVLAIGLLVRAAGVRQSRESAPSPESVALPPVSNGVSAI